MTGIPGIAKSLLQVARTIFLLLFAAWPCIAVAANPTRILVVPFHVAEGDQYQDLREFGRHADKQVRSALRLIGSRVEVIGVKETEKLLSDGRLPTTEAEASKIAEEASADLVIYGLLSREGNAYRMRGYMRDMKRGRMSVSTDIRVSNKFMLLQALGTFIRHVDRRIHGSPRLPLYRAAPPAATGGNTLVRVPPLRTPPSPPRQSRGGPWRSPPTRGALRSIDIGDMDGDGKNETVFLHDHVLRISRFEEGGLRTLAEYSERPAVFISACLEDVDGDGIAELLLCYRTPARIESSLIRYVNRNFKVIRRFPDTILGTIPDPADEKKKILVGQRTDVENIFSGEMVRFRMQGAFPVPDGKIMLPPGTMILSFVAGRLGDAGVPLRVIINQDQRIEVFDEENRRLYTLSDRLFGLDRRILIRSGGQRKEIVFPGRLIIADTAGDGENEVLVIKQRGRFSLIQALTWDGKKLNPDWRSLQHNAIISDFRIRDFKNMGTRSLVILFVRYPFLAGPQSVLFAYDLAR